MSERCMPQIVTKRNHFNKIFINPDGTGDGPCYLRHFKRMGKPGSVMIPQRGKKNLRFIL